MSHHGEEGLRGKGAGLSERGDIDYHHEPGEDLCARPGRGEDGASGLGHGTGFRAEKSPYLLPTRGNAVDWYPWGTAAFEAAAGTDKPIFLSIGYSDLPTGAASWSRESFEDPQVAAMLNDTFICIK